MKLLAAAAKPNSAAILTKPVNGRLPRVTSTASTKSNSSATSNYNSNNYNSSNITMDRRGDRHQLLTPADSKLRSNNHNNHNNSNLDDGGVDSSITEFRPHRNITPVPQSPLFNRYG